jgi:molybdopterin converting factor small subunit
MKLEIKYYGVVAEITGKSSECYENKASIATDRLEQYLFKKYPKLENVNFNLALNQQIVNEKTPLKEGDEIALLPPFAGG